MKHQWKVRRQLTSVPDGQRRWDWAYQLLLQGADRVLSPPALAAATGSLPNQEAEHENCRVSTGLDLASGASAELRATTRPTSDSH